ncbi:hypothetical protein D3C76_1636480 [compost metagenome]
MWNINKRTTATTTAAFITPFRLATGMLAYMPHTVPIYSSLRAITQQQIMKVKTVTTAQRWSGSFLIQEIKKRRSVRDCLKADHVIILVVASSL